MRSSACFISPYPILHPFHTSVWEYAIRTPIVSSGEVLFRKMHYAHVFPNLARAYNRPQLLQEILVTELRKRWLSSLEYLVVFVDDHSFALLDEALRICELYGERDRVRCVAASNVSKIALRARFGKIDERPDPSVFLASDTTATKCFRRLIDCYLEKGKFTVEEAVVCAS